ncbi:CRISPR-associated protein Cas4/endonuclease Cas1 fusion [Ferrovum myxofaciens]|uniref:CRISPR-associated endonuclease Cas1 n=1 Tax=Ferrovum myxofaciens TaxID=416213 RepID=A0A149VWK2_9PROT|nr:CRISPR-associated endonuclease Cas1 [Ferrovum myxofaciens]KXW57592.1 CRISPR-associated protein Cas4/endonuclease Cas1 fusion [Ferrovum myxofaciens]
MSSLYIDRKGIELEADGEALVFRENGARVGTVPLAPLSRIFLRGDVRLQSSLLGKLGERGIGVIVLSGRIGKVSLLLARPHNDASRRVQQYRLSQDDQFCLYFSRDLVREKIFSGRDYLKLCREKDLEHRYEITLAMRKLEGIADSLHDKDSLASVRGAEGAAAAAYFQGIAAISPPRLKFNHRNRRPPRDPLNALLSLGYTMLHGEAVLALYGAGFDPYIGFFHQMDFGRESLACDMVEPLRVEVDRFAIDAFRSDILRLEDFSTTDSGCMLGKNGRARFYEHWENLAEKMRKRLAERIEDLFAKMAAAVNSGNIPGS